MESIKTKGKYGTIYYKNKYGKLHRENGPAILDYDGTKEWFINGVRHREDGPAIEIQDQYNFWYLDGFEYTEKDFKQKMRLKKIKSLQ